MLSARERYVLTFDDRALREVASRAPYEALVILANGKTYGGGGIFNDLLDRRRRQRVVRLHLRARIRPPLRRARGRVLHLARRLCARDARSSSRGSRTSPRCSTATRSSGAPGRAQHAGPDAVAQGEVRGVRARHPGSAASRSAPNAGPKATWTRCFARSRPALTKLFGKTPAPRRPSARSRAPITTRRPIYRPQLDCIMFTRDDVPFCRVCEAALEHVIDSITGAAPRP